jgi:hypothetical protein
MASGAIGGSEPRHLEPWVVLEQLNEALPDNAGSAKNSDWDFLL